MYWFSNSFLFSRCCYSCLSWCWRWGCCSENHPTPPCTAHANKHGYLPEHPWNNRASYFICQFIYKRAGEYLATPEMSVSLNKRTIQEKNAIHLYLILFTPEPDTSRYLSVSMYFGYIIVKIILHACKYTSLHEWVQPWPSRATYLVLVPDYQTT